ncbi:hypothetical protein BH18THE1_BH18THE1_04590 [soil metagenome]
MAGIQISNELDTKDLPPSVSTKLKKIMLNTNSDSLDLKKVPSGAADQYLYKISIKEGQKESVIECKQYNRETT